MTWTETLTDIFSAYLNQETFEDAANGMVFVSSNNLECHHQFMRAFNEGIAATKTELSVVISIINESGGYGAATEQEALALLSEFRDVYLEKYLSSIS